MKLKFVLSLFMLAVVCLHPLLLHAQPDPGGDPDVPIDGGLSLLVAAGVGYAAKKGWDKRRKVSDMN